MYTHLLTISIFFSVPHKKFLFPPLHCAAMISVQAFLISPALPRTFSTVYFRTCTKVIRQSTMSARRSALVTPDWIASQQPITILDASWHLPTSKRDAHAEYIAEHIPNARYFDIDAPGFADRASDLPHMLPNADEFAIAAGELGVSNDVPVVVYAKQGFKGAARAWWMFRVFGKENVYLLDGGLEAWKKEGKSVESGPVVNAEGADFVPNVNNALVRNMHDILAQLGSGEGAIIDARSQGRFDGSAPEPKAGLSSGHMPGAFCVPSDLLVGQDGKIKSLDELTEIFQQSGVDKQTLEKGPISLTCGSGVTAAIDCLALYELGVESAVYDGSWSEYASYANNPIEASR